MLLFSCMLLLFLLALRTEESNRSRQDTYQLETAIRRACVTCYAVEGRYPKSLKEIEERYGVMIDSDAYLVRYDAYAENLMPDIWVVRREDIK